MSLLKKRIDAFIRTDKWNIGYVRQSAESLVINKGFTQPINWLREEAWDCAADPFVFHTDDELLIFYEEIKRFKDNGEIHVINNMDFRTKKKVSGFEPAAIHYSYPYIIQDNGYVYCIPESSAASEISLYKVLNKERTQFGKVKTLLRGRKYIDTSIVKYKDMYWLFTTCKEEPHLLWIYFSDRLDGTYRPHRMNPITVDPLISRGAGNIFSVNEMLYRPTQNETQVYGGSVLISRINELTEHTYNSEHVFELVPQQPNAEGMHHISVGKEIIVVDGKSKRFVLENMVRKVKYKMLN